jgi:hypothetical protein
MLSGKCDPLASRSHHASEGAGRGGPDLEHRSVVDAALTWPLRCPPRPRRTGVGSSRYLRAGGARNKEALPGLERLGRAALCRVLRLNGCPRAINADIVIRRLKSSYQAPMRREARLGFGLNPQPKPWDANIFASRIDPYQFGIGRAEQSRRSPACRILPMQPRM